MSVSMAAPMYHNCVVCRCFFCPLLWGTRGQPPDSSLGTESDQNQFFSVLGRVSRVLDIALSENSVEVVPLALLDMRPVQWCLRLCPHRYHQSTVVVSQGLHQALCWWRDSSNLEQGQVVGIGDPPSVSLHRRLSSRGAFNESCRVSGHWTGLWASRHILELQAVVLALRQFLPRWHRYHVIIRTDSTVAAAYVNRMGG